MRVETHHNLRAPQQIEASRVVVYDNFQNPIALVIQMDDNTLICSSVGQPDFQSLLKSLGIRDTTVVTDLTKTFANPVFH